MLPHVAPPRRSASALFRVRLKTINLYPCDCRLAAIRLPMMPRPMNPMVRATPSLLFVFDVRLFQVPTKYCASVSRSGLLSEIIHVGVHTQPSVVREIPA